MKPGLGSDLRFSPRNALAKARILRRDLGSGLPEPCFARTVGRQSPDCRQTTESPVETFPGFRSLLDNSEGGATNEFHKFCSTELAYHPGGSSRRSTTTPKHPQ